MAGEWIIPFKGRKCSREYDQNFLWKKGTIYVMDNHRAALWCWLRHLKPDQKYNLFHIDAHSDALSSRIDSWKNCLPDLRELTIDEYLHREDNDLDYLRPVPVISWSNYVSLFLELVPEQVDYCIFATHGEGDDPRWKRQSTVNCYELRYALESISDRGNVILNVDLDYFFDDEKPKCLMFSEAFIKCIFTAARSYIDSQSVAVATLALSPECCGGWKVAESLFRLISDTMGLGFSLPSKSRPSRRRATSRQPDQ
ncbi:MAG: UPF0489 family protein [Desulfomonilaceae bacterium]